ncbi:flagellar basal body rod protein FlgC [Paralimibaculum aggregatum]|uniref:Flagellar basal body rod protein FlgC n=1 Tax=Paralimibaculum aggregatum TaxID=3036245 RepID=A0ABQ6LK43_9RHOB|nr:flagellar basal body protein [Limibaculum sp. NKW23]GMG83627.1 flagellar basal body rod protein FlgC [Limibaculum sp. NKW23]
MHDLVRAMSAAASGMGAQSTRLRLIGENLANVDTPGFQRKRVSFESALDTATGAETVRAGRINLSPAPARESYEPGHPLADARGIVTYSNVDPLIEIADAREAQRSYQANLTLFDQARRMYGGMLELLRR